LAFPADASKMTKTILRTVARTFSVLLGGGALINLSQAAPDLAGPWPEAISRVLAIVVSGALAWWLWRAGAKPQE
jgi:hypothetical protein